MATEVLYGEEAMCQVAALDDVDTVMAAIVGAAGLLPTMAAVKAGKRVLLANKEALVMSGQLFIDAVAQSGAELMPVDSEHNAIFQCLPTEIKLSWGAVIYLNTVSTIFCSRALAALSAIATLRP